MKLINTFLIIMLTLSLNSTAYTTSYSQLEGNQTESFQSAQIEPYNNSEDDDDEC